MACFPGRRRFFTFAMLAACVALAMAAQAGALTVKMLPGEKWWGLCNNFGREMPFAEKSEFSCNLRRDNYGHQSLSFLCSDKGRAIWCSGPAVVEVATPLSRVPYFEKQPAQQ